MSGPRFLSAFLLAIAPFSAVAEEALVAVAANFLTTAETLAERFEAQSGHEIVVAHGATGQIYAQIKNGAPYDIFLSADAARPALLLQDGRTLDSKTYAIGQLTLVARGAVDLDNAGTDFAGKTVALADPTVAPYGLASTSAMENLGLDTASFRAVLLSDVGQVASIFATGNADIAFVANSVLPLLDPGFQVSMDGRHPIIRQDGVLMARSEGNAAAAAFWAFLDTPEALDIIQSAGYGAAE